MRRAFRGAQPGTAQATALHPTKLGCALAWANAGLRLDLFKALSKLSNMSTSTAATLGPPGAGSAEVVLAVLSAMGVRGRDVLPVLVRAGEKATRADEDRVAAFNRVRLRSIGADDDALAEEGGAVSDAALAKRLSVSRSTVHNYREAGRIFALPRGPRNLVYPAWLVHEGRLLPGLEAVLKVLRGPRTSPLGLLLFFLTPAEALDDRRPLDLLRAGESDAVMAHAQRYGVIGA